MAFIAIPPFGRCSPPAPGGTPGNHAPRVAVQNCGSAQTHPFDIPRYGHDDNDTSHSPARHGRARGGTAMNVAFIGLGGMGLPMARRVLEAGHTLAVYNRTRARAEPLTPLKPVIADSPAAAARGAEVLVTMVADDAALEGVMLGDQGALAALPRGAVHVSMSTISPALARRLEERHHAAGHAYVAA